MVFYEKQMNCSGSFMVFLVSLQVDKGPFTQPCITGVIWIAIYSKPNLYSLGNRSVI